MAPALADLLDRQHGVVLRKQAIELGVPAPVIDRLVRERAWVVVRRGVYTTAIRWDAADAHRARPLLRIHAASRAMVMPHVVSHVSSARLQGLPVLAEGPEAVHVTRLGHLGGRVRHGVNHHQAPFTPEQIRFVGDMPVLDAPRTVADVARYAGLREGVVVGDGALRAGATRAGLAAAIEPMSCWPGVTTARAVLALAHPGAESPGESLARLLLTQLGLGEVETQFGLRIDGRDVRCDLRVGRHVVEFDGRVKYRREGAGGLAEVEAEEVVWREKRRQDRICALGLGMSRLTWADLTETTWDATARRLHGEILATRARLGSDLGDLRRHTLPPTRISAP